MNKTDVNNFIDSLKKENIRLYRSTNEDEEHITLEQRTHNGIERTHVRYYYNSNKTMFESGKYRARLFENEQPIERVSRENLLAEPYMYQILLSYIIAVIDNE